MNSTKSPNALDVGDIAQYWDWTWHDVKIVRINQWKYYGEPMMSYDIRFLMSDEIIIDANPSDVRRKKEN